MRTMYMAVFTALMAFAVPSSLFGQENNNNAWGGRALVTFNVGAQTNSPSLVYEFTTTLFQQNAKAGLDIPGRTSVTFDVGAGVRLVQNLGVGVTYSRYSNERTGTLTTTIPDPLNMYSSYYGVNYNGPPSTIKEEVPMQREENAIHIAAIYRLPMGSRVQVGAFGGPSYFRCADDHITKFSLEGDFSPAWTVAFFDTSQTIDRGSAWGYHGGASLTYLATKHVGVGTTVRYSQASHTTENHFSDTTNLSDNGIWGGENTTTTFTMKHGGIQWNGGVTLHF